MTVCYAVAENGNRTVKHSYTSLKSEGPGKFFLFFSPQQVYNKIMTIGRSGKELKKP